jgi:uncharacterized SAM-binding protein YcdF (DUF218 family)
MLLIVFGAVLVWLFSIYIQIGREAAGDALQPADAIIVFGAAEYAGRPSPVLKSRLDHALTLWRQHYAPVIITTGGYAEDPVYSEGGVGAKYLAAQGVPESALISETQASDTRQSARRVSAIMHKNGMKSCIAVSDGYHLFRIKRMMAGEGIEARGTPRRELHSAPVGHRIWTKMKEALSYSAWMLHLT